MGGWCLSPQMFKGMSIAMGKEKEEKREKEKKKEGGGGGTVGQKEGEEKSRTYLLNE